jgi:hypothetical protein
VHCDLAMGVLKDMILAEDTFEFNSWEGQGGIMLPISLVCSLYKSPSRAESTRQQQLS